MTCFHCGKEIKWSKNKNGKVTDIRYKQVALDRPYKNLFFHIDCLKETGDMLTYLGDNIERVIKY